MFIDLFLLFRLIFIPIAYIMSILLLWPTLGIWVLLLGLLPLTTNILILSSPVWNFLIFNGVALFTLYYIGVFLEPLIYTMEFWGILSFLLCYALFLSIIRNKFLPISPMKIQAKFSRLCRKYDQIIVSFDPQLSYILDVSSLACVVYGWKRSQLVNRPTSLIYQQNLTYDIPFDFWYQIREKGVWNGFMDIKTKTGLIFEERAQYRATFDSFGNVLTIDKKIYELRLKKSEVMHLDLYKTIFEENTLPAIIVNRSHKIFQANPALIKMSKKKPVNHHTFCVDLFKSDNHLEIANLINRCFDGTPQSFSGEFEGVDGIYKVECAFIPFREKDALWTTNVIVMFKSSSLLIQELHYEHNKKIFSLILKDNLTELHKQYPNTPLRVYTKNMPKDLLFDIDIWSEILSYLFKIALLSLNPKHSLIFSAEINLKSLSVLFDESPYQNWEEWEKFASVAELLRFLEHHSVQYKFTYEEGVGAILLITSSKIEKYFEESIEKIS